MEQRDFLRQAEDHILGKFNIPILDKEPIWKILNASMTYIYGIKYKINEILEVYRIPLEEFTKMLSKSNDDNEVFSHYCVIYILNKEVEMKIENQPISQNSDNSDFYCDANVSTGELSCDFQCSDCKLMDSDEGLGFLNLQDWQKQDILSSSTNKQKEKTIWDLKLHEQLNINYKLWVTRVPGGWLYRTNNTQTFVKHVEKHFT